MPWQLPCLVPILQAPIGSAAGVDLCSAVSNAGALGGLALTWRSAGSTKAIIEEVRRRTQLPFYGNFALHFDPKTLGEAIDAGIPILTCSWGDPSPWIKTIQSASIPFGVQVTSQEAARKMLDLGASFLIVQGLEAGGHVQGNRSLSTTLEEVLLVSGAAPIFAAGGLATGYQLAQVIAGGATGGVIGTRFLTSIESEAHSNYKQALLESTSSDTVLTNCFDIGWPNTPHRVLRNSTLKLWEACGCPPDGKRPGEGETIACTASGEPILRYEDTLPRHDYIGQWEPMCLYSGTGIDFITKSQPAAQIVGEIWRQAQESALR